MKPETTMSHVGLTGRLINLIDGLNAVLDREREVLEHYSADRRGELEETVRCKQQLTEELQAYAERYAKLPGEVQRELGAFATDHAAMMKAFGEKLQNHCKLIEVHYRCSELRVRAALDAANQEARIGVSYDARAGNVVPFRQNIAQNISA